jgi:transcriptional regulator PpsR
VKVFRAPNRTLGNLDAETAAALIETAADVALVLDRSGVIEDLAFPKSDLASELAGYGRMIGRRWADTVDSESRPKIEALLQEAADRKASSWRHIIHQSPLGVDLPIQYSAVRIGSEGRIVALGRDLRGIAKLQQQLVEAQVAMERDYSRLRHMETRYRLLFQVCAESVLIIDASSHKVIEANPAAIELLGGDAAVIVGRSVLERFGPDDAEAVLELFSGVLASGRVNERSMRLEHNGNTLTISVSLIRQGTSGLFLMRMLTNANSQATSVSRVSSALMQFVDRAPDAIVITDREGRIAGVNSAFVEMAQLTSEAQAQGQSLDRWLGRPGVDLKVLMVNSAARLKSRSRLHCSVMGTPVRSVW